MIVDNLHVNWAVKTPTKADPEMIVDTDRVLTRALSPERPEMVVRRNTQIRQYLRSMQHSKLALSHVSKPLPLRLAPLPCEQRSGVLATKRANHKQRERSTRYALRQA
jgi:hypothetical protein